LQHAQIGQLRGKPLGLFSSAQQLGVAGDELRRATGNHYLFSLQEGGGWRLLHGDVDELPLLKYANDVHGSGDMANAALMQLDGGSRGAGMMVALERIRRLDDRVLQPTTKYYVAIPTVSAPYTWFPHPYVN
jgi:hypothetical protein